MASIGTLVLKGKSGTDYSFNLYDYGTSFSSGSGLYVFTNRHKDSSNQFVHTLIYLGKTSDLSERFNDHHKKSCIERNKANCIGVHSLSKESDRDAAEKDLLAADNYTCNEVNN